ncbi:MAG: hypothetical protein ACRDE6_06020 [Candidatus Limnocylindria bacterium]
MRTPTDDQRRRFEHLCMLRSLYARRGPRDTAGVMTLAEVGSFVQALLTDPYLRADAARSADSTV